MKRSLAGLKASFGYAFEGIQASLKTERNMKIHFAAAAAVLLASVWMRLPGGSAAMLILACSLVISLEILNTAIEKTVDLMTKEPHPLAKIAKDAAAGAVFLAAVGSVGIGLCVLGPPFYHWLATGTRNAPYGSFPVWLVLAGLLTLLAATIGKSMLPPSQERFKPETKAALMMAAVTGIYILFGTLAAAGLVLVFLICLFISSHRLGWVTGGLLGAALSFICNVLYM